jgi:hypothetical protein
MNPPEDRLALAPAAVMRGLDKARILETAARTGVVS